MEKKHKERILDRFHMETDSKQLVVLDIEDDYEYMDEELVQMIRLSVDHYL